MTPDHSDDDDEPYRFADPPAHELPQDLLLPPEDPSPVEAPRKRRKKRRHPEGEEPAEPEPQTGDRILDRVEEEPRVKWWKVPVWLIGFGFLLCLVPIIYMAVERGVAIGAALALIAVVAIVIQVALVTALLSMVGHFFGIDYGPVVQAVTKLAAVVVMVDGMTGALLLVNPCALVVAVIIGCGVFQYLFRLSVFEMLLSVAGVVGAAWVLNAVVVANLMAKS